MNLLAIAAIYLAYIAKGLTGFANTLVFSVILGFRENNIAITPTEMPLSLAANVYMTIKNKAKLKTKIWLPITLLVLAGSVPGALFLKMGDARLLKTIFGVVVVALAVQMFLQQRQTVKKPAGKLGMAVIGLISGAMCGLFGIGAVLAAYVGRMTDDPAEFRGNISLVFLLEGSFRFIVYTCTGIMTWAIFKTSLMLMPFAALGLVTGTALSRVINEKTAKYAIIAMLAFTGIVQIVTNVMGLL